MMQVLQLENEEQKMKTIKFNEQGLVPVITQSYDTNEVLMMAYMNEEPSKKRLHTIIVDQDKPYGKKVKHQAIFKRLKRCMLTVTKMRFCCVWTNKVLHATP